MCIAKHNSRLGYAQIGLSSYEAYNNKLFLLSIVQSDLVLTKVIAISQTCDPGYFTYATNLASPLG